jgi:hypothetical protein
MMEIKSVEETVINDEITLLDWVSIDGQFGRLTIEYNGSGGYTFDAEFLGLDTVVNILTKWKETKLETDKTE